MNHRKSWCPVARRVCTLPSVAQCRAALKAAGWDFCYRREDGLYVFVHTLSKGGWRLGWRLGEMRAYFKQPELPGMIPSGVEIDGKP